MVCNMVGCLAFGQLQAQPIPEQQEKGVNGFLASALDNFKGNKRFLGRFDDATAIELILDFSSNTCTGSLLYQTSKTHFNLKGKYANGVLMLEELDDKGILTGKISAQVINDRLEGSWENVNNTIGMHLTAEEATPYQVASPCTDNKWFHRYTDQFLQKPMEINIFRAMNGSLSGSFWVGAEEKLLLFSGQMDSIGNYKLNLKSPDSDSEQGYLKGSLKNTKTLELIWVLPDSNKRFFKIPLRESLMSNCYQYADYMSSYDIVFPRFKQSVPAMFFERNAGEWASACKNHPEKRAANQSPESRNTLRTNGWTEISMWDDKVLSGFFTFANSWDSSYRELPFNFNLAENKSLELKDVFLTSFNVKSWLKAQELKNKPGLKSYDTDEEFKKWADATSFEYFVIRKDGILLCSPFHQIYGRQSILLDWNTVKPYLRMNSAIAHLLE